MLLDVQCKFMFKSDCKILRYGRFKIVVQAWVRCGDGIDPEVLWDQCGLLKVLITNQI